MEEEQQRMQSAVYNVLNDIDKKCLRKLQIQMYQCSIECCKDTSKTVDSVEICNKNCSKDVMAAKNYVQKEFDNWQQRIQRCFQDCGDAVTDKMPTGGDSSNEHKMDKYIKEAEACSSQCISKYIKMLPQLGDKIVNNINNKLH